VHRVQRVPVNERNGRRHTSTVTVVTVADIVGADAVPVSEMRFDVYRAPGAGGQHRNKTDFAVRATHTPTGIVAVATESRSQHQNRAAATARLRDAVAAAEHAARSSVAARSKADVFNRPTEWSWCGWRDQVVDPAGRRYRMRRALTGRFA